jgi:hypothetical protein
MNILKYKWNMLNSILADAYRAARTEYWQRNSKYTAFMIFWLRIMVNCMVNTRSEKSRQADIGDIRVYMDNTVVKMITGVVGAPNACSVIAYVYDTDEHIGIIVHNTALCFADERIQTAAIVHEIGHIRRGHLQNPALHRTNLKFEMEADEFCVTYGCAEGMLLFLSNYSRLENIKARIVAIHQMLEPSNIEE